MGNELPILPLLWQDIWFSRVPRISRFKGCGWRSVIRASRGNEPLVGQAATLRGSSSCPSRLRDPRRPRRPLRLEIRRSHPVARGHVDEESAWATSCPSYRCWGSRRWRLLRRCAVGNDKRRGFCLTGGVVSGIYRTTTLSLEWKWENRGTPYLFPLGTSHSPFMVGRFAVYDRDSARTGIHSSVAHPRCFTWRYCRRCGRRGQEKTLFS